MEKELAGQMEEMGVSKELYQWVDRAFSKDNEIEGIKLSKEVL